MATRFRLEDGLDGVGILVPWKSRIVLILEEKNSGVKWYITHMLIQFKFPLLPMHKNY